ncbi:centromere protein K [Psammomys obesus]|uniref:centromere protein K n=1 Tax=Psammomys obesus TaxID=48139 RepID=UPI0024529815|nr:centromere protein K [Psammomys obesus]
MAAFAVNKPGAGVDSGRQGSRGTAVVKVLECGVCEDVFSLQGDKVPRLLLCGHTVCHDCLTRLPLHGRAIRCPFDRQVTDLGDSGVWGLKKNFALLELLERLQNGHIGQYGAAEEAIGISGEVLRGLVEILLTRRFLKTKTLSNMLTHLTEDALVTLGKEEFQKLRCDLEMVLSTIQSKNEKLKEDLEREQQWLDEQQQILETLNVLHSDLKNQVVTFSESRIFNELKAKMLSMKEFKEKLLVTLGEFLEDHFPLPDGNTKKKRKNIQESNAQLITLNEMLEILINRMFDVPHDPYVKISDSFWPPYIELLLRYGIALRHPEDPTRIRLEAFHQ